MARGINQEAAKEIFSMEPTALLEMYVLYYDYANDTEEQLYFHAGTNGLAGKIIFDGQEYLPMPAESEGFEVLGDQRLPRPKIRVSNAGLYVSSLLRKYQNLNGAKLIRRRTFTKFLDDVNFPNNKNPWGSANPNAKLPDEKYFISRKTVENKMMVEFELISSLDLENVNIPAREISSRYCSWIYRGFGCRYGQDSKVIGDDLDRPVATIDDELLVSVSGTTWSLNQDIFPIPKSGLSISNVLEASGMWDTGISYNVGDYVFRVSDKVKNSQQLTASFYSNHPAYYVCKSGHTSSNLTKPEASSSLWVRDACSKKLEGCKHRYNNAEFNDGINNGKTLRFGGFPGTDSFNY